MTVYIYENFTGTASLHGTTPETNLQSGLTWSVSNGTVGQTLQLKNDNGFMKYTPVAGLSTDLVLAILGDAATTRGLPASISASFLLETHSSTATDSRWQINLYYSGLAIVAYVEKTSDTDWSIYINGVTTTISGLGLPLSTAYPVTISVADGAQSITALGVTASATAAFSGAAVTSGLTGIALLMRNTGRMKLEYVANLGHVVPNGVVAAGLPRLVMTAFGSTNVAVALPSLSAAAAAGTIVNFSLPAIGAASTAHDSTGEQAAAITLPALAVSAFAGGVAKISLPGMLSAASATTTGIASPAVELPALAFTADATVSGTVSSGVNLPTLSATSFAGAVCSITLGGITSLATGTTGSIGRAQVTLPLFSATASATAQNFASADITLPSMWVDTGAMAPISLPGLVLTAIGSAVVTATYEAYAMNLKHTPRPGVEPVDEVTHYTNFPFTHVVRYKNSYYGANSTGLYLLEGTTDDATPITWAVKTAMTDFDSPQRKTVASAYFGGRLGPADTITLHAGEGAQTQAYSYTTPRGALAQNYRQAFGKGIKQHRYYALEASGTGDLALDDISLDVHNLSRRI